MEIELIAGALALYIIPSLLIFIISFMYYIKCGKTLKKFSIVLLLLSLVYYTLLASKYFWLSDSGFTAVVYTILQIIVIGTLSVSALLIFLKK